MKMYRQIYTHSHTYAPSYEYYENRNKNYVFCLMQMLCNDYHEDILKIVLLKIAVIVSGIYCLFNVICVFCDRITVKNLFAAVSYML